jgi:hypothetical protein
VCLYTPRRMTLTQFPRSLATTVGEVIGQYYFHHDTIDSLFYEAGASGDVPAGSCRKKVAEWLVREGAADPSEALTILGKVIQEFMDGDTPGNAHDKAKDKARLESALARHGLQYGFGGRIYGAAVTAPSRSLGEKLRECSIPELEEEFDRAHRAVDADPPAAITAACAIIETLCKVYIQQNGLTLPTTQTVKPLWSVVAKHLKLAPESIEDDDLKRVLAGLSTIIDGIGAFRTHAGSAHGHGKRPYRALPRHARLVVHAAHTVCLFVMETWQERGNLRPINDRPR